MEEKEVIIENPYGFVYITTNLVNGKRYLGQKTMNSYRNWKDYLGSGTQIRKAIKKYGRKNFYKTIVCFCYSQEELNKVESDLSVFLNGVEDDGWYNLVYGGGSTNGWHHSEKVREDQRERSKKLWKNEEFRQKFSEFAKARTGEKNSNYGNHKLAGENNPNYGKHASLETRAKISEANKNISEEKRKKLSEAAKERFKNEEYRQRLRDMNIGRKMSEESKEKLRESLKKYWTEEKRKEYSQRFSGKNAPFYGRHHSEETKRILSEKLSGENNKFFGTHLTEEHKRKILESSPLKKSVVQLDFDGNFVAEYISIGEAARVNRTTASHIVGAISTKGSSGGYLWVYKEEYDPEHSPKYKNNRFVPVVQVDKDGKYIATYFNSREAERQTGVLHQNIGRCCNNKHTTSGGYFWRKLEDYDPNEVFSNKKINNN